MIYIIILYIVHQKKFVSRNEGGIFDDWINTA